MHFTRCAGPDSDWLPPLGAVKLPLCLQAAWRPHLSTVQASLPTLDSIDIQIPTSGIQHASPFPQWLRHQATMRLGTSSQTNHSDAGCQFEPRCPPAAPWPGVGSWIPASRHQLYTPLPPRQHHSHAPFIRYLFVARTPPFLPDVDAFLNGNLSPRPYFLTLSSDHIIIRTNRRHLLALVLRKACRNYSHSKDLSSTPKTLASDRCLGW